MKPRMVALVALAAGTAYVGWRLVRAGGDPVALAELPSAQAPPGSPAAAGYDGQFAYAMAMDPEPSRVATRLDVPAYRYQRIVYPLLARAMVLGRADWIPWSLLLVNVVSHALGAWALARLLQEMGVEPGYGLAYALWVGLVAGVGLDLHEPLAYALVALAWLARRMNRAGVCAVLMGMALFTKETTLLFWAPLTLAEALVPGTARRRAALLALGGLAFAGWQVWLASVFGAPGLGSGGAMATPFEWIPYMGLLRIGEVSLPALGLFVVIFGPTIVLPSLWGILAGVRSLLRRESLPEAGALALNAVAVAALPFSTFREPLGLVRFAAGLVLATLLFSGSKGLRRPLVYSLFWSALIVILFNG